MCNGAIFWPGSMNITFLEIIARILKVADGMKCQNLTEIQSDFVSSSQRLLLNALFHIRTLLQCLKFIC